MDRLEEVRAVVDDLLRRQPDEDESRAGWVHLYGVACTAALLALRRGLNVELCTVAAMLHDIWSTKTGDPNDHARLGAIEARGILGELGGFSAAEIEAIAEAITQHSKKAEVHGAMAELLKDADVLHHYLYNPGTPVIDKEKDRLKRLLAELGVDRHPRPGMAGPA